jgi:hypothetical protein
MSTSETFTELDILSYSLRHSKKSFCGRLPDMFHCIQISHCIQKLFQYTIFKTG